MPDSIESPPDSSAESPFRISQLRYRSGLPVDLTGADVIVLVGPNNSGKSRTLQEINNLLSIESPHAHTVDLLVLDGISFRQGMSEDSLREWLERNRKVFSDHLGNRHVRTVPGGDFALQAVPSSWNSDGHLGLLASQLVRPLFSAERLGYLGAPSRLDSSQRPDHPIQLLVRDNERLAAFSNAFRAAFRTNVIVDAWGQSIRLRVSRDLTQDDFQVSSNTGLPDEDAEQRLAVLPLVDNQSDGVKSFAGILLTLLTMPYPLILLDEPEAFLHPPQARLLGRYLSALRQNGQLIVATHSLDILLGLLEGRPERVLIVRLSRREDETEPLVLDGERVQKLWRDPLLRFSRAFDGLFHEGVVVCEGDTDSQFYSAVAYHLAQGAGGAETTAGVSTTPNELQVGSDPLGGADLTGNPFDLLFTYGGGKQRMATIAGALSAVGVPVRIVADFDVLNDRLVLKRLVESIGGEYDQETERLRSLVDAGLRGDTRRVSVGEARTRLGSIIVGDDEADVTAGMANQVKEALEPTVGWRAAKRSGLAVVPTGEASEAAQELIANLARLGIFVVGGGAVESFVRQVGNKGPRWVTEVVEGGFVESASEAKVFVQALLDSFSQVE